MDIGYIHKTQYHCVTIPFIYYYISTDNVHEVYILHLEVNINGRVRVLFPFKNNGTLLALCFT